MVAQFKKRSYLHQINTTRCLPLDYNMAALDKLAIRGIRSFDDKRMEVIQFFTPVTVIVGQNGSGKTTIIECLKYATTGEQPPNTRGGAFVHDPKMAAEKEVKAQVKLRFRAANGNDMMITRNLSVTLKKSAGMAMKTLESLLSILPKENIDDRKRKTISTKCAEMDAEMPNLLGVSKAVLDNVIFCHQEESYWPLSEASVLKKKFDEIFEASKYTKALDAIRSLRKDRVAELKVDKERLEGALREKTHADKLKNKIADLSATIARKEADYEEEKTRAEELSIRNKDFYEKATKFRDVFRIYENATQRKDSLESDYRDTIERLEILQERDAELEHRRENFQAHTERQQKTLDRKRVDLREEEDQLAEIQRQLGEEQKKEGQLLGEEQAYHKNVGKRDSLVHDISKRYGLKGFDGNSLTVDGWQDFRSRMDQLQQKAKGTVDAIQEEGRSRNQEYTLQIQNLSSSVATLKAEKEAILQQMTTSQNTITSSEAELDRVQARALDLRGVSSDVEQKRGRIEALRAEIAAANYERQLEQKNNAIRALEAERDRLTSEMASITQQMESRTNMALRKEEARRLDEEIENTLANMSSRYQQLLGRKPQVATVDRELERTVLEKEKEIRTLEMDTNAANKTHAQIESTISNLKGRQKQLENEAKGLEKKLTPLRGEHPTLDDALKDAEEQLKLCREETATLHDSAKFYDSLLRNGRNKKVCTSCNRHLQDEEMAAFEKHVMSILKKDKPTKLAELQEELENWESELANIQQGVPMQVTLNKLKQVDIPGIVKELATLEKELEEATTEANSQSAKLGDAKIALKTLQALKQQAGTISVASQKRDTALQYAQGIEEALGAGGSFKTLEEVQAELSGIQTKQHAAEREKQGILNDRDRQNKNLHTFESELHQLVVRENELQSIIKERDRLEQQVKAFRDIINNGQIRIRRFEADILKAHEPIKTAEAQQTSFNSQHNVKVVEAQKQLQDITLAVDKLDSASQSVEEYNINHSARNLKRCRERIVDLEDGIERSKSDIAKMREEMEALSREIASAVSSLSTLKSNLRLRKIKRDIEAAQAEIDGLDLEEASKARQQFDEKYARAKEAEELASRKSQHLAGELASLRTQLQGIESDAREYQDANKKYTEQLVRTKMADMVNNDLEKYAKALDSAIMKYHTIKMQEVNDIMGHLWSRTYQGTDIDGIKIISEGEGATAGRKTYNYRVVMIKDQVEMDMRGRCSAGQKMLASIIIRLALSDSFGANCGILALDEPTNALDVDNIEALAQSLVDIIRERRSQANFQLVIITHDEGFLRKLGEASVIDQYWRVSRDGRQKSTLEKQAIGL